MPADKNHTATDWSAACRALAEAVRHAAASPASGVRRVEVDAPPVDPLDWLAGQPAPRGFWQSRDADTARAFTGVAQRFEEASRLCAHLDRREARGATLRYYGGVRFDPARPASGGWQHFGPGAFVLPRFELVRHGAGVARLACHLTADDETEAVAAHAEQLAPPEAMSAERTAPSPTGRHDQPGRDGWTRGVREALHAIAGGALRKVVLARRTALGFDAPLDPVHLLSRLCPLAPEGFAFLIEPQGAGAFVGVSPERLFRQRGREVQSEAVAGTRPRASAAAADAALRDELLQSEKDRREHALVQHHVRDALRPLCESLEEHDAAPLTLRNGRHLYARLEGRLETGVLPADVLHALHPTPAVGGLPTGAARRFIREHEPFDRGWYAAPVGWVGLEEGAPAAELAVGIRSGLVRAEERGGRLDLFAGAGLVEGSVPEKEWDEVEHKLGNFTALF